MDEVDKRILDRIQSDFPLERRPFKVLGDEFGIEEEELIERIKSLLGKGFIRRVAPIINSRKIGLEGTLVAARVPEEKIGEVAEFVSEFTEVSHNYERTHDYNLWFTISAESKERIEEILARVREETDAEEVIDLPSKKMYKIGVSFSLEED